VVTTDEVTPEEAFARWQDLIGDTFVPLVAARPSTVVTHANAPVGCVQPRRKVSA
jgi:hypothetical protein